MSIPIYTESPISPVATKATAVTPHTTSMPPSPYTPTATAPAPAPATTTAATPATGYLRAQPGSAFPTPTRTTSLQTSTYPPAPTPHALPAPSAASSRSPSPRREIPPPPRIGERAQPPSYYAPVPTPTPSAHFANPQPFPPQMGMPSPSDLRSAGIGQPPASVTSPYTPYGPPSSTQHNNNYLSPPTTARLPLPSPSDDTNAQRRSLEHPPGYVQNPYAADMTPEQRFATQHGPGSPSLGYGNGNGSGVKSPGGMLSGLTSPLGGLSSPLGGILNGSGNEDNGEGVWGALGGWVKGAGKKLSQVEGEVWKRINGD